MPGALNSEKYSVTFSRNLPDTSSEPSSPKKYPKRTDLFYTPASYRDHTIFPYIIQVFEYTFSSSPFQPLPKPRIKVGQHHSNSLLYSHEEQSPSLFCNVLSRSTFILISIAYASTTFRFSGTVLTYWSILSLRRCSIYWKSAHLIAREMCISSSQILLSG